MQRYARTRQSDQARTIYFTNTVVRLFSNEWLALAAVRNAGLALLDMLPFAKTLLARQAMGFADNVTRLK